MVMMMMIKIDSGASLSQVFSSSPFNGVVVVMNICGAGTAIGLRCVEM
jgi:hypothetical protein